MSALTGPERLVALAATLDNAGMVPSTQVSGQQASSPVDVREAEIDFGRYPRTSLRTSIADASVTPATQILAYQAGTAATGRQADENELEALVVRAVAGAGQFTVYADCLTGRASGRFRIAYLLG